MAAKSFLARFLVGVKLDELLASPLWCKRENDAPGMYEAFYDRDDHITKGFGDSKAATFEWIDFEVF